MNHTRFLKGQIVEILPEFQDTGDSEYTWIVIEDEEKGRVSISAINSKLAIRPIHVVKTAWIRHR